MTFKMRRDDWYNPTPKLYDGAGAFEIFRETGEEFPMTVSEPNSTVTFGVLTTPEFRQRVTEMINNAPKIFTNAGNNPIYLVLEPKRWLVVFTFGFETVLYTFQRRKGRFSVIAIETPQADGYFDVSTPAKFLPHSGRRATVNLLAQQLLTIAKTQRAELQRVNLDLK